MPVLICYDIALNSLRTRVSQCLLKAGLERINRSVFLGPLTSSREQLLARSLERLMQKADPDDSLMLLHLTDRQVTNLRVWGNSKLDTAQILNHTRTLIL